MSARFDATSSGGSPARRGLIARRTGCAGHPVERVEHLEHRQAAAVAAVQHELIRPLDQPLERGDMGVGKIADMDIVAHAGAVGRRIVGAEHIDMVALARPPPRPRP